MISVNNFKNIASFRRFPVDNRSAILLKFKTKIFENFFRLVVQKLFMSGKRGHFRFDICIFALKKCPKMSAFHEIQMYCSPNHSKGHEKRDKVFGEKFFNPSEVIHRKLSPPQFPNPKIPFAKVNTKREETTHFVSEIHLVMTIRRRTIAAHWYVKYYIL